MTTSYWETASLGQQSERIVDGSHNPPPGSDHGVPMYSARNVAASGLILDDGYRRIPMAQFELEHRRTQVAAGDVLLTIVGTIGRTYVVRSHDLPFALQRSVAVIRPKPTLQAQYLLYWLSGPVARAFLERNARGTAQKGVYLNALRELPVSAPGLDEQHRIVAAIETHFSRIDAAFASLTRAKANLKRARASVLKAAVEGRLVPTEAALARAEGRAYEPASVLLERILAERKAAWAASGARGKYAEPAKPETEGLPGLPEGWVWTSLGQAFVVEVGATPSRQRPDYWGGEIAWVSSGEVQFCRIKRTRETITSDGLRYTSTKVHPTGTVLLGMIGQGRTRGQAAILDIEACNNQNCAAIRVSEAGCVPEFVYGWLELQYDETRRLGGGNNQQALNKARVEAILLPLAPLAEQRRIVTEVDRRLSVLDALDASVDANLARCARLRQSVLKRAFEGRLVSSNAMADVPLLAAEAETTFGRMSTT